jgi:hypothetical protein
MGTKIKEKVQNIEEKCENGKNMETKNGLFHPQLHFMTFYCS